ncbi:thiol:disulfide interchange protein DsbA/DsbL [Massilia sp. IC2-477]|uniref:thiol:disulfide interchange protein DsbA/DsbL n=1 Tax=unclassified Massilia TaxID=2609279 RepID=UPI001D101E71|nr:MULTISPECIES: thiol:disulfide interchange protein DsbA/DsbL [unclassified Massilia]MCC2954572.1 thiol:disulfide interchange protein DsbA/DsbL [Massilia sp. IC2-477]MCC2971988.1 thiol:disulfide interchange protein DsbA/DsbL [Massilia sp. IC2-476]
MRSLRFALIAATMVASTAFASPADPKNGVDYQTLSAPQPVQATGKKVEVIEFFAYHCPACNALEPTLNQWIKKQGDNIVMRRIHLPFQGPADPEAHLFLTLEAMGKLEEYHPRVFQAVHVQRQRLMKDDAIIEWAAKNGLDRAKFMETWNSFGVTTKLRRLEAISKNYKVSSTPTIIIDGKYVVSPGQVSESNKIQGLEPTMQATTQVMDALVKKAAASK